MTQRHALSVRGLLWLAGIALATLLLGFGGWASLTTITGAVIAQGQLTIEDERRIIQHPAGGVIDAIHIREGQHVDAGSLLLQLEGAELRSELIVMETRYAELMARRARVEAEREGREAIAFPESLRAMAAQHPEIQAELDGQRRLMEARRSTFAGLVAQLDQRQMQISAQIDGIDAQLAALAQQRRLTELEYDTQSTLLRQGLTQAARTMALERDLARIDGEHGALRAERAAAAERAAETRLQILSLGSQRREDAESELREIMGVQSELAERLRALRAEVDRLDLHAPVSGVIYGLQVKSAGSILRAADPALFIVPQDSPLIIETRIRPSQIDHVFEGQRALVSLSGLNTRAMHQSFATVTHMSADTFSDSQTREDYFRVELQFQPESMSLLDPARLLPGMPVEVFLQTAPRRPIDYLTRPLTEYFTRALREA